MTKEEMDKAIEYPPVNDVRHGCLGITIGIILFWLLLIALLVKVIVPKENLSYGIKVDTITTSEVEYPFDTASLTALILYTDSMKFDSMIEYPFDTTYTDYFINTEDIQMNLIVDNMNNIDSLTMVVMELIDVVTMQSIMINILIEQGQMDIQQFELEIDTSTSIDL